MIQTRFLLATVLATCWVGLLAAAESHDAKDPVLELERQRCDAITRGDARKLGELLADDYVHVHGTGKVDSKAGFIANILEHPRRTERGELKVRVYDRTAVVTGEQYNYMPGPDATSPPIRTATYVTQVLHYSNGHWQFVSFQLTPVQVHN